MGANQWNLNFKLEMIRFRTVFGELLYSFILNAKINFFSADVSDCKLDVCFVSFALNKYHKANTQERCLPAELKPISQPSHRAAQTTTVKP